MIKVSTVPQAPSEVVNCQRRTLPRVVGVLIKTLSCILDHVFNLSVGMLKTSKKKFALPWTSPGKVGAQRSNLVPRAYNE